MRIETQGEKVVIQGDIVKINGQDYSSYIKEQPYLSRNLYVKQATSLFKMVRGFGFRVLYGYQRIFISVDPFYDNKVAILHNYLRKMFEKGVRINFHFVHLRFIHARLSFWT